MNRLQLMNTHPQQSKAKLPKSGNLVGRKLKELYQQERPYAVYFSIDGKEFLVNRNYAIIAERGPDHQACLLFPAPRAIDMMESVYHFYKDGQKFNGAKIRKKLDRILTEFIAGREIDWLAVEAS